MIELCNFLWIKLAIKLAKISKLPVRSLKSSMVLQACYKAWKYLSMDDSCELHVRSHWGYDDTSRYRSLKLKSSRGYDQA